MSKCRFAVQAGFLLVALFAYGATRTTEMRITVLDSETHSVTIEGGDVPKNCDQVNFDAYCHNSKTALVTNTLLVQEGNGAPFRITCTVDSKWSRCIPLPKGESFDAKRDKHGITVYYVDENGKARGQLYTLVAGEKLPAPRATAVSSTAPAGNVGAGAAQSGEQAAVVSSAASSARETVKCSFSSTPTGAEVTVDGRYVGSTPSVLGLTTGTHVVVVSTAGYAQWKRELAVTAGSELTVNAVLEKAQ